MKLEVYHIAETPACTLSQLRVDGKFFCFILEDGYREQKVYGQTRIPDGTYQIKKRTMGTFFDRYHRQYGHEFVPHIVMVPNFEYILMHPGNTPKDTKGCLLVGDSVERLDDGSFRVVSGRSTPAYRRLYAVLQSTFRAGGDIYITLRRDTLPVANGPQLA